MARKRAERPLVPQSLPGWVWPQPVQDWLHYFPEEEGRSLCGAYALPASEALGWPRLDSIVDWLCCEGCLKLVPAADRPRRGKRAEATAELRESLLDGVSERRPGKSVLAERIAAGLADPISEEEQRLSQDLLDFYEKKFGKGSSKRASSTSYRRIPSDDPLESTNGETDRIRRSIKAFYGRKFGPKRRKR